MVILAAKKQIAIVHRFLFIGFLRYHGRIRSFEEKSLRANKDGLSFLFHQRKLNFHLKGRGNYFFTGVTTATP
jgi:hypothetical protein